MLTSQSNFSSVMSPFRLVRIFTQKSSTCNVSQIKPTNIVCLFQSLLDHLKIDLIFLQTDLTRVTQMAFLSILNAWTNSKRMVFSCSNRYMYALVYVFIRGHNKKEIKNSQIYSWGFDCLFKNEQHDHLNMTWLVNMTGEWSFWPVKSPFWPDIARWPAIILSPEYSSVKQILHLHLWLLCDKNFASLIGRHWMSEDVEELNSKCVTVNIQCSLSSTL